MHLSPTELTQLQHTLQDYAPGQPAIATLLQHNGDLDASLEALLHTQAGAATFGPKTLKTVTLDVLRDQLCGDAGFRQKLADYTQQKDSAPMLTGLIVYLAGQLVLPFPVDPGLATLVVLYISKVGLEIFCRYTEPDTPPPP
jgi:hypothetical protein